MAADTSDLLKKTGASTVTTLAAPGKALGATSITVGSTTNYPTDTGIIVAIRVVDSNGDLIAGTYTEWSATVTSGTTLAIEAVPVYGSDQIYSAGSTTQVYIPVSAYAHNKLIENILEHANQDGTLKTSAVQDALSLGSESLNGWNPLGYTPNTVTYNGSGSYDLVFNSVDLTSTVSNGMRLRTTRTVAAPNQCASLNGTNQYFNDTTVSGMTFTDDFVVSAWIKVSSYQASTIASRFNGTNGWLFYLNASGQVFLLGNNGTGNYRAVQSYQSVPLNKWVHVTAHLDMSGNTYTSDSGATNNYVMINATVVPGYMVANGTSPTSLVQAGNLEIGSQNGGNQPFPGKIAQVAIYNARVTPTNIRATMSQGLTGSETNLVSAYSLSNSLNDLNTGNANNLTAQNSAATTNADSPFGTQADGTISTTLDYGIVMKTAFSTNTTLTVQVPEGCTIPTTGGVTSVSYSTQKAPYGMPVQRGKWRVLTYHSANRTLGTSASTWYEALRINAPTGSWYGRYDIMHYIQNTATDYHDPWATLSTSSSSATNNEWTVTAAIGTIGSTDTSQTQQTHDGFIDVSTATDYYLLLANANNAPASHQSLMGYITLDNAYL